MHALARDELGRSGGVDHALPWGAALETDGTWTFLLEAQPERAFLHAIVLARRAGSDTLDLLIDADQVGPVAHRAPLFSPEPTVWAVRGAGLERPSPPAPRPSIAAPVLEPAIASLLDMPEVDIVTEHGVVTGECRGVEVARVTGEGDAQRLDVGVGAYDQGAFAVMHPELSPKESLAEVVAQVLEHRRRGAEPHPLNRLVRERWIRAELLAEPTAIGVGSLVPVEGPEPRDGLHDTAPAFAWSETDRTLVACSVGIDLALVPESADVAARMGAERLILVLPERDHHAMTAAGAAACRLPVEIVTANEPWRSGTPGPTTT